MYRADPQTQYAPLDASAVSGLRPPANPSPFGGPDSADALDNQGASKDGFGGDAGAGVLSKSAAAAAAVAGTDGSLPDVARTWSFIQNNMTFKHFAATACATEFFSVPAEIASEHGATGQAFHSLEDVVRPSPKNVPQRMLQQVLDLGVSHSGAIALPSQSGSCGMTLSFEQDSGLGCEGHGDAVAAINDFEGMLEAPGSGSGHAEPDRSATSKDPTSSGLHGRHVFFRLLSSTLAAKKRSKTDRKIDLSRNQFCVQRHVVHRLDFEAKEVHVALSSLGLGEHDAGSSVQVWERPESIRMFLKWQVQRHYHFLQGESLAADAQEAFDLLLKNHGVNQTLTVEIGGQYESMQGGLSRWTLQSTFPRALSMPCGSLQTVARAGSWRMSFLLHQSLPLLLDRTFRWKIKQLLSF